MPYASPINWSRLVHVVCPYHAMYECTRVYTWSWRHIIPTVDMAYYENIIIPLLVRLPGKARFSDDVNFTSLCLVAGYNGTGVPGGVAERARDSVVLLQAVEGGERASRLPTHWLYGNLHQIGKLEEAVVKKALRFVHSNHYKVTRMWLGPFIATVAVHHPVCVKELLKQSKDAAAYDIIKPWLGEGLLIAEGERWYRNRRLLTPAFHYTILKPYVSVYGSCIQSLIEKWTPSAAKKESMKLFNTVCLLSLDIILQCAFSYKSDCQTVRTRPLYNQGVYKLIFACSDRFFTESTGSTGSPLTGAGRSNSASWCTTMPRRSLSDGRRPWDCTVAAK